MSAGAMQRQSRLLAMQPTHPARMDRWSRQRRRVAGTSASSSTLIIDGQHARGSRSRGASLSSIDFSVPVHVHVNGSVVVLYRGRLADLPDRSAQDTRQTVDDDERDGPALAQDGWRLPPAPQTCISREGGPVTSEPLPAAWPVAASRLALLGSAIDARQPSKLSAEAATCSFLRDCLCFSARALIGPTQRQPFPAPMRPSTVDGSPAAAAHQHGSGLGDALAGARLACRLQAFIAPLPVLQRGTACSPSASAHLRLSRLGHRTLVVDDPPSFAHSIVTSLRLAPPLDAERLSQSASRPRANPSPTPALPRPPAPPDTYCLQSTQLFGADTNRQWLTFAESNLASLPIHFLRCPPSFRHLLLD